MVPDPDHLPESATGRLIGAMRSGDPDRVEAALVDGPDMGYRHDGVPLVALALDMPQITRAQLPTILEILLNAGAPLSPAEETSSMVEGIGRFAYLHHRSIHQREDLLSTLLYCRGDDADSMAVLLEHGADPAIVHRPANEVPYGPLESAVALDARRCVAQLVAHGADPNGADGEILTGVSCASAHDARHMFGVLLALGAEATRIYPENPITPLLHPLINRCYGAVLELLRAGANPDVRLPDTQPGFRTARTPRQMLAYLVRNGDEPGEDGVRPSDALAVHAAALQQQRFELGTAPSGISRRTGTRL